MLGMLILREECKKQVNGVVARFKKFQTLEEAEEFMSTNDPKDAEKTQRFVCFIMLTVNLMEFGM